MRNLDGNALMTDGHVARADAIAQAREFMLAAGMDEIAVDDLLVDRPHLIGRAWWSEDPGHFVQERHDGAQPVTVVHVEVSR